jgi:prepilin-type N-terminal cleavage/methylation domain-containing protein
MNMKQHQAGFTLIEIAIVLVIIGLLLGGVLKGQEMIENAKIQSLRNDMDGVVTAYYAYQNRYRALPGDDPKASNAGRGWADAAAGGGNGALPTANAFDAGNNENQLLWQHLRYSGLISGNPAGTTNNVGGRANPLHGYNGQLGISNTTTAWGLGLTGNILCAGNVPGKAAEAIDAAHDDGLSNTGTVRALAGSNNAEPAGTTAATTYVDDGNTLYTVCRKL